MKQVSYIDVSLHTPAGKTVVPMEIVHHDSTSELEIGIAYHHVQYIGNGRIDYIADALANLQSKLPDDVKLCCCMTCRHGNMCPYSAGEEELYCTKDLSINSKEDICNLFDSIKSDFDRIVSAFSSCDDFVYQNQGFYTYNTFLYYLEQRKNP